MRVSPGVSGNAVTPFLVVRRSTRYATMRETMEDRLQSVQMSARSAAERARAASQVAGRMPDYQQSITPGTRADDLPPHDEPPPASLRPPPAPIKMLRVLPEPIIVPPTAPSACVAVVSPASSHPASSHRGSQPTEGDSHWKWAFKTLEQRNREQRVAGLAPLHWALQQGVSKGELRADLDLDRTVKALFAIYTMTLRAAVFDDAAPAACADEATAQALLLIDGARPR